MDYLLISVGAVVSVCAGLMLACLLLWGASEVLGALGYKTWKRLRRVYHINVLMYWLARLEKEGTHCFQKTDKEPTQ